MEKNGVTGSKFYFHSPFFPPPPFPPPRPRRPPPQLHYDLGQILFQTEQYQKSHDHFKQCSELLDKLKGKIPQPHLLINRDKLKGYLAACESLEGDEPKYDTPLVAMATIEQHRKGNMEVSCMY